MNEQIFKVAMYLRLSRDDGDIESGKKAESNSIGSQREMIRNFIREQEGMELYDIYVDDGFSGSNFERPEFKRMMNDVEALKVNCVIVKDLSRFGRDYIEAGRFIQKTFPAFRVRFIAITDKYDSFYADSSESSIILPVKNFINDSYCRDISMKVKSQLEAKRKNGEFIGAFAVYGYSKNPQNKKQLVVDEYAADVVKKIFFWKMEGFSAQAIAIKLNDLGILSPLEYKKSKGTSYCTGFSVTSKTGWTSVSVKRILINEVYLGHLIQGKRQKINYKVNKVDEKQKEEWVRVENTHEPIISDDMFQIVQNLLKNDGRTFGNKQELNPYTGVLFCGDCREQMIRRINRYKEIKKVFYICSTKNRGEGCTRHSIEEDKLNEIVRKTIVAHANTCLEQSYLFEKIKNMEVNFDVIPKYDGEMNRLKTEQDKYYTLCSNLYEDLGKGILSKDDFGRLQNNYNTQLEKIRKSILHQEEMIKKLFKQGIAVGNRLELLKSAAMLAEQDLDRRTLVSLIKAIYVYEDKRIEVEFYFMDEYKAMLSINKKFAEELMNKKQNKERSA